MIVQSLINHCEKGQIIRDYYQL